MSQTDCCATEAPTENETERESLTVRIVCCCCAGAGCCGANGSRRGADRC